MFWKRIFDSVLIDEVRRVWIDEVRRVWIVVHCWIVRWIVWIVPSATATTSYLYTWLENNLVQEYHCAEGLHRTWPLPSSEFIQEYGQSAFLRV